MGKILESFLQVISPVINFTDEMSKDYREALTKNFNNKVDQRFLGGSEKQAKFVFGLMISQTTEADEVLIYSRALEHSFYSEVLTSSKCRIRIILDDVKGLDVIKSLPQDVQRRVACCYILSHDASEKHFIMFDNAFRCEVKEGKELYSVSNFNEPDETIKKLRARFERHWKDSILCVNPS